MRDVAWHGGAWLPIKWCVFGAVAGSGCRYSSSAPSVGASKDLSSWDGRIGFSAQIATGGIGSSAQIGTGGTRGLWVGGSGWCFNCFCAVMCGVVLGHGVV